MKKFIVDYASANTGYGWTREFDRLEEFEGFIKESRGERYVLISVWDNTLGNFIYYRRNSLQPDVDMLSNLFRDMRTTTREAKRVAV